MDSQASRPIKQTESSPVHDRPIWAFLAHCAVHGALGGEDLGDEVERLRNLRVLGEVVREQVRQD